MRKVRVCLRCDERFVSESCANRVCRGCKGERFGRYADPVRLEREELRGLRVVEGEE